MREMMMWMMVPSSPNASRLASERPRPYVCNKKEQRVVDRIMMRKSVEVMAVLAVGEGKGGPTFLV
jgi:hypothetical protein